RKGKKEEAEWEYEADCLEKKREMRVWRPKPLHEAFVRAVEGRKGFPAKCLHRQRGLTGYGHRPPEVIEQYFFPPRGQDITKVILQRRPGAPWLDCDLPVGLSPMADSDNINNPLSVIDAVNNPVVSNSDTPQ